MERRESENEAVLRALNSYRDRLASQIRELTRDLNAVERSIRLLDEGKGAAVSLHPGAGDYSGLKALPAVERFLRENSGKAYKASEIAKELVRRRFQTKAKTIAAVVTSAANRLSDRRVISKNQRNGVNVYCFESAEEPGQKEAPLPEGRQGRE